ncbi:MAG: diguanylate cyclase (GGDEF)-like protein [Sulfurimonas sp.]|jgi:diguanylate cyclase (GGDEF)-like protein
MNKFINKLSHIGVLTSDTPIEKSKKITLTLLAFSISVLTLVWGMGYLYFNNCQASFVPFSYLIISVISAIHLYKTKKFIYFESMQLFLMLLLPFILMWILGGYIESSFVFIWSFYVPVLASIYGKSKKTTFLWFIAFIFLVFISMFLGENSENTLPILLLDSLLFFNIVLGLGGIFFLMNKFIQDIKTISQELKNVNVKLQELVTKDIVTKLPNRLYFQNNVQRVFDHADKYNKSVAIAFLDLDGFKAVNDTHGHEAGDMILKIIGKRLQAVLRPSDLIARIGGDEFAIALADITDVKHVEQIAKTIIKDVNQHCPYKEEQCHVGISIGISFYPKDGTTSEELIKKADSAMYDIKKLGKNNFAIYKEN